MMRRYNNRFVSDSSNADVREAMSDEVALDKQKQTVYVSLRFVEMDTDTLSDLLLAYLATEPNDVRTGIRRFGEQLQAHMKSSISDKRGRSRRVPDDAGVQTAEMYHKHYLMRAVCRMAGTDDVEIYRGIYSQSPRPESSPLIGQRRNGQDLLAELREPFDQDNLHELGKPNSGLCVKRV